MRLKTIKSMPLINNASFVNMDDNYKNSTSICISQPFRMLVNICTAYSGHQEIVSVANRLCQTARLDKKFEIDAINETLIEKVMCDASKGERPLDLCLRTSENCRLSGFRMWHQGNSMIHNVKDIYWPQLTIQHVLRSIILYQANHQ